MTEAINGVLVTLINFLFGPIMLCVYFGVGIMMTIRLRGVQFRRFGMAFRECVGNIGGKDENGLHLFLVWQRSSPRSVLPCITEFRMRQATSEAVLCTFFPEE